MNMDDENVLQNSIAYPGKTTIAPEVLIAIVRLTTLDVPGVCRMGNLPSGVNRLFHRKYGDGVRINIHDDIVSADLYIILENDVNMRDVSRRIQDQVARSISEMVGMQVGQINVHIEDVEFASIEQSESDG